MMINTNVMRSNISGVNVDTSKVIKNGMKTKSDEKTVENTRVGSRLNMYGINSNLKTDTNENIAKKNNIDNKIPGGSQ